MYKSNPLIDFLDQEATVKTKVNTRGKYQHLLVIDSGERAGEYLAEEMADEYCEDGLKVIFDAELLSKKGMVYKPGPTDIPEADYEVPMIRILSIRKSTGPK